MASSPFNRILRATERGAAPGLRRLIWRGAYEAISRLWRPRWPFLNYGYIPPDSPYRFAPEDEAERPFLGLYAQAVEGLPLMGAEVLEVGAGHGGGAAWLARQGARAVTGLDLSGATVALAARLHAGVPGLVFQRGDAEAIPFATASFDLVVNIESSHCYGRMERFAAEAARVLRPGGWLSWADMRSPAMLPALDAAFAGAGLELHSEAELNPGVIAALDAMDEDKAREIARFGPLRPILREFTGLRGSLLHGALGRREVLYLARRYRKP